MFSYITYTKNSLRGILEKLCDELEKEGENFIYRDEIKKVDFIKFDAKICLIECMTTSISKKFLFYDTINMAVELKTPYFVLKYKENDKIKEKEFHISEYNEYASFVADLLLKNELFDHLFRIGTKLFGINFNSRAQKKYMFKYSSALMRGLYVTKNRKPIVVIDFEFVRLIPQHRYIGAETDLFCPLPEINENIYIYQIKI